MTALPTDDELRRDLRQLCNQGRHGPARLSRAVAAVLVRHGLAEQVSDSIWIPTPRGRSWCEAEEALGPRLYDEGAVMAPYPAPSGSCALPASGDPA